MESVINSSTGRNDFMRLLVAQLQHQDPLEPVPQHEFLAQLAQFSQLEGIERLNTNFESLLKTQTENQKSQTDGITQLNDNMSSLLQLQQVNQGASLVGQHVIYTDPKEKTDYTVLGNPIEKKRYTSKEAVSAVELIDGSLHLRIGKDEYIPMNHVYGIADPTVK